MIDGQRRERGRVLDGGGLLELGGAIPSLSWAVPFTVYESTTFEHLTRAGSLRCMCLKAGGYARMPA
jgi:hypothetical protein